MFPSRGVKLKVTERAKIKNWYCYAVLILLLWPRQLHYRGKLDIIVPRPDVAHRVWHILF